MKKRPREPLLPRVGKRVFVDPSAQVIGDVRLGDYSSIWPGCVLRGDINKIVVGRYSNVQDLSVLHVEREKACIVGDYVVVGHNVVLHACKIGDQCLVGMGSIVLDGAVLGKGVLLGAGSLVTHGQKLEAGHMYFGRPAKKVRKLSREEIAGLKKWAQRYVRYAADHLDGKFARL
ncbi:MAG TPA: gamma carbonic anhydrase family protein [Verrucomicrobiae bacterium]|nr:gamma carbonic anhydrase family protein [Verrucomicrobiae bacterium]